MFNDSPLPTSTTRTIISCSQHISVPDIGHHASLTVLEQAGRTNQTWIELETAKKTLGQTNHHGQLSRDKPDFAAFEIRRILKTTTGAQVTLQSTSFTAPDSQSSHIHDLSVFPTLVCYS